MKLIPLSGPPAAIDPGVLNGPAVFNTEYRDAHGKITSASYSGWSLGDIFNKAKITPFSCFNITAADGYFMTVVKENIPGEYYIVTQKDGKEMKPTFIVKDNADGKLRVVDVESIAEVENFPAGEEISIDLAGIGSAPFMIGHREYKGCDLVKLMAENGLSGEYIKASSEDGYVLIIKRRTYLGSAFVEDGDRRLIGTDLKLGNWMRKLASLDDGKKRIVFRR